MPGTGPTSLAWSRQLHGSEDTGVYGIEVDGELLVDSGVSLNSVPSHASSLECLPRDWFFDRQMDRRKQSYRLASSHGLSTAPKLIFVKGLTGSVGITAGHDSARWTKRLQLNDPDSCNCGYRFL